jgi:hypothetical protein
LRIWLFTILKLVWGIYLVLTSIYCLLAFLPYTYFALIKAPPYDWMPGFAHHQAMLYCFALLAVAITQWPAEDSKKRRQFLIVFGALASAGLYLVVRPFMPGLQNNWTAYFWSLIALAPLLLVAASEVRSRWPVSQTGQPASLFPYSTAVWIALSISLTYAIAVLVHTYFDKRSLSFGLGSFELTAWSVISHLLVALIVLSTLNLIRILAARTRRPATVRYFMIGSLIFALLWIALVGFLNSALSFQGWAAHLYSASFAAALTLWLASLLLPFAAPSRARTTNRSRHAILFFVALALSAFAIALPTLIGGGDWNGAIQHTFTLFFWIAFSACIYALRPRRATYSVVTIFAVLLLAGFTYKALQATVIFWARPLGSTDDDVARAFESYATNDISFQMAHHILGNERSLPCGDLCRILRQYTNIRDAEAKNEVKLVDPLLPTQSDRPNIFILIIDSVRPDYLGAYNPQADFTPNIDAFARDSITVHNAYTQYAGTTLSEPAIWSGAMLLHAHYMQPFSKVNSLEKLANVDGYQMILSYDTVLSQILAPADNIIKLDADKPLWNRFETCSTLQQTEAALDARTQADKARPVLFYAQPMNVHQFASNNMPRMTSDNWRIRHGFNNRIAYELHQVDDCLGPFFTYLKTRGLYDNSIVILASDHGDATGEFGRISHSTTIYPEIIRVPLIVHLPAAMRAKLVYDDTHISALTDIAPSLYYLLGHRPIRSNPIFGHPIFVETQPELDTYRRNELFVASDERAVFGLLSDNGRFLYTTYDSPAQSMLFDLSLDPNAQHNLLTDALQQQYAEQIINHLHAVGDFYGYKPGVGSLLAAPH